MPINPPPPPSAASTGAARFLGIDIGGTKIAVGVVAPHGAILAEGRIPTLPPEGPDKTLPRLVGLCHEMLAKAGAGRLIGIGIVSPGPLDLDKGLILKPANLPTWDAVPIVRHLKEALGVPAFLDNDANAAALAEHRFGAGRGIADMVYLTISTGIGGGIIANNHLVRGANGNAGEIGHMSVAFDGRPCPCGNVGCIEAYASGTALAARAREAAAAARAAGQSTVLAAADGDFGAITGASVVEAVRARDAVAVALWDETMKLLGAALRSVIHVFNPRRIILGGGLTSAGDLLFEPVRRHARHGAIAALADVCDIVPAECGQAVGVLGAAAVAIEEMYGA